LPPERGNPRATTLYSASISAPNTARPIRDNPVSEEPTEVKVRRVGRPFDHSLDAAERLERVVGV
jgi:hypothetical protein